MNGIVSLLVLLSFKLFTNIQIENYEEIQQNWKYNPDPNYRPTYQAVGVITNNWDVIPTVPFEDDDENIIEFQNLSELTIQAYKSKHYDPTFMSINRPNYDHFEFKKFSWFLHRAPKKCLYPQIGPLLNEYSKIIDYNIGRILLKNLFICPIDYYWMDYSNNQFPRYILQGFCKDKLTITSKECRPCETKFYIVLRRFCQDEDRCKWVYMKQNLLIWCTQFY